MAQSISDLERNFYLKILQIDNLFETKYIPQTIVKSKKVHIAAVAYHVNILFHSQCEQLEITSTMVVVFDALNHLISQLNEF